MRCIARQNDVPGQLVKWRNRRNACELFPCVRVRAAGMELLGRARALQDVAGFASMLGDLPVVSAVVKAGPGQERVGMPLAEVSTMHEKVPAPLTGVYSVRKNLGSLLPCRGGTRVRGQCWGP